MLRRDSVQHGLEGEQGNYERGGFSTMRKPPAFVLAWHIGIDSSPDAKTTGEDTAVEQRPRPAP